MVDPTPIVLANLGPPSYRVTTPADSAPYYSLVAGFCLGLAILLAVHWWVKHRTVRGRLGRLTLLVFAGCVSIGWFSAWIAHNAGRTDLIPLKGAWNYAVELPSAWLAVLVVLTGAGMIRFAIWRGS